MDFEYSITQSHDTDPRAIIGSLTQVLLATGFQLADHTGKSAALEGPGMTSTKQNPVLGASRITVVAGDSTLDLRAELGGVRFMRNFVYVLPASLAALGIVVAVLAVPDNPVPAIAVCASTAPWVVISPLMARWIRRRTCNALTRLVESNIRLGKEGGNREAEANAATASSRSTAPGL